MSDRNDGDPGLGTTTQLVPTTGETSVPDLHFKTTSNVTATGDSGEIPFRARSSAAIEKRLLAYRLQQRLFGITDTALKIGHYTLIRKLGEGGMGVVYVALDEHLNREVALKLLSSKDSESAQGTLCLQREARAMAKVAHPNVVGVYEVGESDGCIYISMELIKGVTLRDWMNDDARPWGDIVDAFIQAGAGLAAAHRSGLVHRDFKPENVMIGHDGRVKVLDFGLAFARAPLGADPRRPKAAIFAQAPSPTIDERITDPNVLMGTLAYMSPEQFHESAVDAYSDQFSFCVALFEALFRVAPFAGRTYFEIVGNVLNNRLTPIPAERPAPSWITAVLLKGLSIDPKRRYASITELTSVLSAGRRSTSKLAPRRGAGGARDGLCAHLDCAAEEVVAQGRTCSLLRLRRRSDGRALLARVPSGPDAADVRESYRAYFQRTTASQSPAILRPTELVDEDGLVAIVFDAFDCVPLSGFVHQGVEVDAGVALRIALGLTDAIYHLAGLGFSTRQTTFDTLLVGVSDHLIKVFDPGLDLDLDLDLDPARDDGARATVRYRIVGLALLGLLTSRSPDLASEASPQSLLDGNDPARKIPDQLRRIIEKLLDPAGGYRAARGVRHDLSRCAVLWRESGDIPPFPLGERDLDGAFSLSSVVHGRSSEIAQLRAAHARVLVGTTELFLVSGPSGIGKTRLIDALCADLGDGRTITGKFNQFGYNEPYATIVQALRELLRRILEREIDTQAGWRARILAAVEPNAELLFSVVPELRALIGAQPAAAQVPPGEASARFETTLKRLLYTCGRPSEPLIIVLDDLQWCDDASLTFISSALKDVGSAHILWVGAYRDNEISDDHPIIKALIAATDEGARCHRLSLGPLTAESTEQMLLDTLACPLASAAGLCTFIMDKTNGNPLFARTLLLSLHDQGLMRFSPGDECWRWDDEAIRSAELPSDIVALMRRKIDALSAPARLLLATASCIGRDFEGPVLLEALRSKEGGREVYTLALDECVAAGLLSSSVRCSRERSDKEEREIGGVLNFTHDRVQQAAHDLVDEVLRRKVNLEIGTILLDRASEGDLEEQLFRIVGHLNAGSDLATGAVRERMIELNLLAGKRAVVANAFAESSKFLQTSRSLLPKGHWTTHYDVTLEIYLSQMHAESLLGNYATEESIFQLLRANARTPLHIGQSYELKVALESSRGEQRGAILRGIEGLRALGERIPGSGNAVMALLEFAMTWWALRKHSLQSLVTFGTSHQERSVILSLLVAMGPPAYLTDSTLLSILMMRIARRSLSWGLTDVSSYGFAGYGLILSGLFHRYEQARELGAVAEKLNDRFDNRWLNPKIALINGIFILPWTERFETCEDVLRGGTRLCVENADFAHASYTSTSMACVMYYRGAELALAGAAAVAMQEHTRKASNHDMTTVLVTVAQACLCLTGQTESAVDLSTDTFSERDFVGTLDQATTPVGLFFYRAIKIGVLFLHGKYDLACALGQEASLLESNALSNPSLAEYLFYHAMSLMQIWPTLTLGGRVRARRIVKRAVRTFGRWARLCPANFAPRFHLLQAEHSRIKGSKDALHHLNTAVDLAVRHRRVQYEAIGLELAHGTCLAAGQDTMATVYLRAARAAYGRWGAVHKLRMLPEPPSPALPSEGHLGDAPGAEIVTSARP